MLRLLLEVVLRDGPVCSVFGDVGWAVDLALELGNVLMANVTEVALVQLLRLPLAALGPVGARLRLEVELYSLLAFSELEGLDVVVLALEVAAEVLLVHAVAALAAGERLRGVGPLLFWRLKHTLI